jgi:DNA modification methylase
MVRIAKVPDKDPIVITIQITREMLSEEITVLNQINKKFPKAEIELKVNPGEFIAFLYKLDPLKFQEEIDLLIKKAKLDLKYQENFKNPFQELIDKINAIGSYGIRYRKRVYAGYADERKVSGRKEKVNSRETYFYARNSPFIDIHNQLPEKYNNTIICGDSEEILKTLPDNCIDIIITSPPYNFGLEYSSSGDSAHWEEYLNKLYSIFSEGIRVLSYGGRFIVNVQPLFSDYIPLHHLVSSFFMSKKMIWKGEILWEKNNYNCKYTSWGSWKSPSSPYLKYTWEFVEVFCKGALKKSGESINADISDEEFKTWVVARWSIGPERRMKEYNHPAMFPEELVERCLKLFSFKNDIILDPFNGTGTTTAVASRLNRRFLGIDISSEYCECAKNRINNLEDSKKDIKKKKSLSKDSNSPTIIKEKKKRGRPSRKNIRDAETSSQHKLEGYYSDFL